MTDRQTRSNFVNAVAWTFIALSGFTTLISLMQNLMVQALWASGAELDQALQTAVPPGAPAAAAFMLTHFRLFLLAFLLISVFTLVSAIGLLKRRNWARICFVGVMILGIGWSLAGILVQQGLLSSMGEQMAATSAPGAPNLQPMFTAIGVVSALFAVTFSVLFAWIAKRLLSAPVVAEFRG